MLENQLAHYGILGMKWGVRRFQKKDGTLTPAGKKRYSEELKPKSEGVKIGSDGSISIKKGVNLQRLVSDESKPLKDLTYASVLEYDNAKYVRYIGGKGIFGGGRDRILSLKAKTDITAPSVDEATKIFSNLVKNDPEFRKNLVGTFGLQPTKKEFEKMDTEPTGDVSKAWYWDFNVSLGLDFSENPSMVANQRKYKEALKQAGYNALRDENDFTYKVAKAPIIILDPEDTLEVVTESQITDSLRSKSKETLNAYKKLGKDWVDKYLYE